MEQSDWSECYNHGTIILKYYITLYLILVNFGYKHNLSHVTISPSTGSTTAIAGEADYSLNCSSTLFEPSRLPSGVPSPNFQWFFGPNGNASLPSGLTPLPTTSKSNSTSETYTSSLSFSPLGQSHAGMYTCRLGAGRLVADTALIVNGM